jgi:hypothetical protein
MWDRGSQLRGARLSSRSLAARHREVQPGSAVVEVVGAESSPDTN